MILAMFPLSIYAADDVVPGEIHIDPTFVHIGLRWLISGDDDLDATCTLRFRPVGTSTWFAGMDLIRAHSNLSGQGGLRAENRFAGSIFFLAADTDYEIELTITDPDGGGSQRVVTASTGTALSDPVAPVHYYAVPGDGGGTGSQTDPFQG